MEEHRQQSPPSGPQPPILGRRAVVTGVLGAAGTAALAGWANAGPLTPPAGPVAPTAKPLNEVDPRIPLTQDTAPGHAGAVFVITRPGSYYLTADVTVGPGMSGIRVEAPDVTIDLNGFTITGFASAGSQGISATTLEARNLTVRNGTIESMGDYGIAITSDGPYRLSDLRLRSNLGYGLVTGAPGMLERVAAVENASGLSAQPAGMVLGSDSLVLGCTALGNNGTGISAGGNCLFSGCIAAQNTGDGIAASVTSIVTGCDSRSNGGRGFQLQHSALVESCTANQNTGAGIMASFGSSVRDSAAQSNGGAGISVWEGALIAGCQSSTNSGDAFVLASGSAIVRSGAHANSGIGINAHGATGGSVSSCVSIANFVEGIRAGGGCVVRDCTVDFSNLNQPGGAGIHITGIGARVEENVCFRSGRGLWAESSRALILRNRCANNPTNWSIAANCAYGAVQPAGPGAAVLGNGTVPSSLGSADPHANFTIP